VSHGHTKTIKNCPIRPSFKEFSKNEWSLDKDKLSIAKKLEVRKVCASFNQRRRMMMAMIAQKAKEIIRGEEDDA
jgi:hypothetical protein